MLIKNQVGVAIIFGFNLSEPIEVEVFNSARPR
jgi:hypothetical protein